MVKYDEDKKHAYFNGEIPKGHEVHHKNKDKLCNEIENLKLLTNKKHMRIHADDFLKNEERRKESAKILNEKARPKAIEWHKSEAGREWHKSHYEEMKDKLYAKKKYTCYNCGKEFEATVRLNKFCSNNCKSAWRRKQGLDNDERTCVICGNIYSAYKYSKSKTCSRKCRGKLRSLNAQK